MRIIRAIKNLPEILILIVRDLTTLATSIREILGRLTTLESPKPVGPTLGTILGHATRLEAAERRLNHIENFDSPVIRMIAVENAKKLTLLADRLKLAFDREDGAWVIQGAPRKSRKLAHA
jgi:hypothetical protein